MKFRAQSFTEAYAEENQDFSCYCHLGPNSFFAAIADGVGGHFGGQLASHIAVETAREELAKNSELQFSSLFSLISEKIKVKSCLDPEYAEMATTLSLFVATGSSVRFAHVGDSRIYHLRNAGILQITEDQSEVALLVRQGILNQRSAKTYRRRSVLYSALSAKSDFDLIEGSFNLIAGDRILLLTDGVYRLLHKGAMRDMSLRAKSIDEFLAFVGAEIGIIGKKDDATIVGIDVLAS